MFDYIGLIISMILILLGFVGSVLPVLPGPPLSLLGLFLCALTRDFSPPLTPMLMLIMLTGTIVVTVVDYLIPLIGAKRYGTSNWGIYGSVAGMIIGVFFPPFGILLGAFIGAVLVEWMVSRKEKQALRSAWGILIGSLLGTIFKLGISGIMGYYFIVAVLT